MSSCIVYQACHKLHSTQTTAIGFRNLCCIHVDIFWHCWLGRDVTSSSCLTALGAALHTIWLQNSYSSVLKVIVVSHSCINSNVGPRSHFNIILNMKYLNPIHSLCWGRDMLKRIKIKSWTPKRRLCSTVTQGNGISWSLPSLVIDCSALLHVT